MVDQIANMLRPWIYHTYCLGAGGGWPGFPGSYFLCHGCVSRELSTVENRMKVICDILELRSILTLMEKQDFFRDG